MSSDKNDKIDPHAEEPVAPFGVRTHNKVPRRASKYTVPMTKMVFRCKVTEAELVKTMADRTGRTITEFILWATAHFGMLPEVRQYWLPDRDKPSDPAAPTQLYASFRVLFERRHYEVLERAAAMLHTSKDALLETALFEYLAKYNARTAEQVVLAGPPRVRTYNRRSTEQKQQARRQERKQYHQPTTAKRVTPTDSEQHERFHQLIRKAMREMGLNTVKAVNWAREQIDKEESQ